MKIAVTVEGHQRYERFVGEALHWGSMASSFTEKGYLQVPCVVLNTGGAVLTIPLQTEHTWTRIEHMYGE